MRIHTFAAVALLAITAISNPSEADVKRACKNVASGSYTDLNLCLAAQFTEADAKLNQAYASALAMAADHPSAKEMVPSVVLHSVWNLIGYWLGSPFARCLGRSSSR